MTPPDRPTGDQDHTLPPDGDRTLPSDPRTTPSGPDAPPPEVTTTPASIGNYTILGKLGEGGMGVVYEAEQKNPQRRVALKVVRGGHFVDEVSIKLFQREAETLGRLKHPGIGAIYESGRTDEGQHFFAMELVRGATLDSYIMESDPSVPDRLALFRKICDAVNYAHQRGVIHRDLKPSNILIDEDGAPKILDFGLARITDADTNAASMVSEIGAIKGTLPYMSPEQARGNPDEIDLRTDVYSLGVILYELLTGARPYDTDKSSILEAVRVIAEQAPPPFAAAASTAGRSRVDRLAGGELETITRKALEKNPDRRYQSAAALSDDIERHLTNQPILARPPSTIYQLKKLVVRNKLPFTFAATLVLLLIGFGIWMSVLFTRADLARRESEAVTDFLSDMLAAVDPGEQGRDVTVREVLDAGAGTIESEFENQPLVQARLMYTMGEVYKSLGIYDRARPLSERSLATRENVLGPDHPNVAASLHSVANLLADIGDYAEARPLCERALAIDEKRLGPDHPRVAVGLNNLAILLKDIGDYAGARPLYERALAIREKALGPDHPMVAVSLNNLANLLKNIGDYAGARLLYERALAIREKALGPDHPDVAASLSSLADLLLDIGDHAGARPLYERALAIEEKALGPDHPKVAASLNNLANLLADIEDHAGARPLYERALAILEKALGPDHPKVATSLNNLAILLPDIGDHAGARSLYERALAIREKTLGPDHPKVAASLNNLANLLLEIEDHAGARPLYERALAIWEKALGPDHPKVAVSLFNLAEFLKTTGDYKGARPLYERALAIDEKNLGPDHEYVADDCEALAEVLRELGEGAKADQQEARAKAIREKADAAK